MPGGATPPVLPGLRSAAMSTPDSAAHRALARRRLARTARRWLWRGRFVVVAVCCGMAAAAAVQVLRPAPPPMRDVVVPTHRLAPGSAVARSDVELRAVPADLAPAGALTDPADAVGRVPAVALPAGFPLAPELVAGGEVVALAPHGTVVVPVRLDDSAAALLRPGDRVDLVSTAAGADGDDGYLARRALVLPSASRARDADAGATGLLGAARDDPPAVVTLVAVAPEEAPALSAASGTGTVGAVLVP
jgi:Flp pilus assembly protein CpaB